MRKNSSVALLFAFICTLALYGCPGRNRTPPVRDRIAKIWIAQTVNEGTTTVFTRGGANNVKPTYQNFRLELQSGGTVIYREFDGNTFQGQWSVPTDQRLVLTGLTPQPTGTNGTIEFTIQEIADNRLVLARTSSSLKTGGTTNTYTLIPQP